MTENEALQTLAAAYISENDGSYGDGYLHVAINMAKALTVATGTYWTVCALPVRYFHEERSTGWIVRPPD